MTSRGHLGLAGYEFKVQTGQTKITYNKKNLTCYNEITFLEQVYCTFHIANIFVSTLKY